MTAVGNRYFHILLHGRVVLVFEIIPVFPYCYVVHDTERPRDCGPMGSWICLQLDMKEISEKNVL